MKIGKDKILHFLVCMGATICAGLISWFLGTISQCFCGFWFALGLGLGKEYGDSKASGNKWDWWDILADVIGIACGIGIILLIHLIIGKW